MISPVLEKMSEELAGSVVFLKVDVDECEVDAFIDIKIEIENWNVLIFLKEIAANYKVNVMPTFVLLRNKARVGEMAGANEKKLRDLIDQNK